MRQSTEFFIFVNWWIMDPEVDSRPALFLRCAWFDSGYMQFVSLRSFSYRELVDYGS